MNVLLIIILIHHMASDGWSPHGERWMITTWRAMDDHHMASDGWLLHDEWWMITTWWAMNVILLRLHHMASDGGSPHGKQWMITTWRAMDDYHMASDGWLPHDEQWMYSSSSSAHKHATIHKDYADVPILVIFKIQHCPGSHLGFWHFFFENSIKKL